MVSHKHTSSFAEIEGGVIIDKTGRKVCTVNVNDLRTGEAQNVVNTIICALRDKFSEKADE